MLTLLGLVVLLYAVWRGWQSFNNFTKLVLLAAAVVGSMACAPDISVAQPGDMINTFHVWDAPTGKCIEVYARGAYVVVDAYCTGTATVVRPVHP